MNKFVIAVAPSRKAIAWTNKEYTWPQLLAELSRSTTTHETHSEYMRLSRDEQSEIKDCGGFVGGSLAENNGRRSKANMKDRCLITLDLDHARQDTWEKFTAINEYAACVYSTHKSTPESPRLRLIIPTNRAMSVDEHEALARLIASDIGFETVDVASFESNQLMYWPSNSRDIKPIFYSQDGDFLDVDATLARYDDWRDISKWQHGASESVKKTNGKMEDPREKRGWIGAFCSVYSISSAIETFIPYVYKSTSEGRYTYAHGSGANGVVVYDDVLAYSHHETDPAHGEHNAFDLVRLHKFGHLDAEAADKTPVNKLPSYSAMIDLCREDKACCEFMDRKQLGEAQAEFAELPKETHTEDSDDQIPTPQGLTRNRMGAVEGTISNVRFILNNDTGLKNIKGFNEFRGRIEVNGGLPWSPRKRPGSEWTDTDDAGLRDYVQSKYGISASGAVYDALNIETMLHKFHPIREYIDSLVWDKTPRLDTMLVDYFGAADNEYTRAVTRKTLVAAVRRVYEPGCKVDTVLALISLSQGIGKSSFLKKLGKDKWFSDSLSSFQGKDAYEGLKGSWIIEIAENALSSRTDVNQAKAFITSQNDRYRAAYERRVTDNQRQCIFIITSNSRSILKDSTGNRRYWPVDLQVQEATKDPIFGISDADVDQLWAEAKFRYDEGETTYLNHRQNQLALAEQEAHAEDDPRVGMIQQFLDMKLPPDWASIALENRLAFMHGEGVIAAGSGTEPRDKVCVKEIMTELFGHRDYKPYEGSAVRDIMDRNPEWERYPSKVRFGIYGAQYGYFRKGSFADKK